MLIDNQSFWNFCFLALGWAFTQTIYYYKCKTIKNGLRGEIQDFEELERK